MEHSEEEPTCSDSNPSPDKLALFQSLRTKARTEHSSTRPKRHYTFRPKGFALPGSYAYTMRAGGGVATGIDRMLSASRERVRTDPTGISGIGRNKTPKEVENMSPEAEKTRREFLEEKLRQDPHNTFARYGLALELAKSEPASAWTHFEHLLLHHPEYSATYFQAGASLMKQGRLDEARKVLVAGIEVTSRQGKQHAQAELQAALDDLDDQ